ncbi:MAG TPA: ribosome biogenesis GTPase Der [Symbiobacteriaceae bacterium]|nr:ribosome biogenesis GTPase Der [Symbiobacteriaceae bacterium]
MKAIVAIVGRPNVGKSTLFNRLTETRQAIVEDQPGVTRDRLYAEAEWNGQNFTLVDTGGIQLDKSGDTIDAHVTRQAELAIKEADVIVLVVDVAVGVTVADQEVAARLRRVNKPVILAVNKVENLKREEEALEFWSLGLPSLITVSAAHGMGTGDLLDEITNALPQTEPFAEMEGVIRTAIIGRPNAGKSSLVNALVGEERVIVSDVAGTTRDAIDVLIERDGQKYLLVDTAGMRKRAKVDEAVERYSVMRALRAVERAQVVLLVIDAVDGVTEQDQRIAGYALEQGKGMIVIVNKWDLIEKDDRTMDQFTLTVRERTAFMDWAEIIFLSAKTKSRVQKLLPVVKQVAENFQRRITTGELNSLIRDSYAINQPPSDKGRRLKIFYATQATDSPPTFIIFINDKELLHFSWERYLENRFRETYNLEGTPIRFWWRVRPKIDIRDRTVRVRKVLLSGKTRVIRKAARKKSTE